ncbi:aldolase [Nitrosomonas sp. PY1]|uniref:class II aldolase/adducin family protein n=1 Tax=Nitrosomonas sp. PY1 TaxID=1803906 RepID=UPI001FC896B4|nr:class II aldolase/adducin family protein [Nitrosomonas sp. PY1]GKS69784.1 aldolase [Nitrosomonas sp. PY1]
MNNHNDQIRAQIIQFCADIGSNPLLVQGAGGNVSWKDSGTLWIKASGTWLAEADQHDIFVPVNPNALQHAIQQRNFAVTPQLIDTRELKPSIETLLHALMPQPVVVHLHAIEILAHLVRADCEKTLITAQGDSLSSVLVAYHKPGEDLAQAVYDAIMQKQDVDVVFLKNHGVVLGGSSIADIVTTLNTLITILQTPVGAADHTRPIPVSRHPSYVPIQDTTLHELATHSTLFDRLTSDWALYPDHVVFLGPQAYTYTNWEQTETLFAISPNEKPELIFIRDHGVFVTRTFSIAKQVQLRCYYDVIKRQKAGTMLTSLCHNQIAALLNWDAEKYRMRLANIP